MKDKEDLKRSVCESIDRRRTQIERIGDNIMMHPELGFKEFETAKLVANTMKDLGISHETGLGITGVKGMLRCKKPGPTLAFLADLDALIIADHPAANPLTKAAHGCGHNAQVAGLLGGMMGMVDARVIEELAGAVVFFAVPAEESVEVNYRAGLVNQGKIRFIAGKPELIRLGYFDDIDIVVNIHSHSEIGYRKAAVIESCNGCLIKTIRFIGAAAHAGSSPHKGINALNAAELALMAIHAQRETFRDEDSIRVHPL